jgi:hypothetical protein
MDSFYNKNIQVLYTPWRKKQRKVSRSSLQFQPRRWMEVSGQRQASVAYTTICSKFQEQLLPICIQEAPVSNFACDNHYTK